jgi:hypothetical protein
MIDGIHPAQDRVQRLNVVTAIMNRFYTYVRVSGNYWTC